MCKRHLKQLESVYRTKRLGHKSLICILNLNGSVLVLYIQIKISFNDL
jgi:hypothetical protein